MCIYELAYPIFNWLKLKKVTLAKPAKAQKLSFIELLTKSAKLVLAKRVHK